MCDEGAAHRREGGGERALVPRGSFLPLLHSREGEEEEDSADGGGGDAACW